MSAPTERSVVVLDLRAGAVEVDRIEGSVLVIDGAGTAAEHDELYQELLGSPLVSGVICLAVGDSAARDEVRIRPAPALGPVDRAATLWVSDEHGVHWRPADHLVRGVRPSAPSNLDQLIAALSEPVVFDAVVHTVSTLPYSTASVGLALERTSLHEAERRRVQEEAISLFTDPDAGGVSAPEPPRAEFRAAIGRFTEAEETEPVLVAGGPLDRARTAANRAVGDAALELHRLDHPLAALAAQRPGSAVGAAVRQAFTSTDAYHREAQRQLSHVNDRLLGQQTGDLAGAERGLRGPEQGSRRQARDEVRELVEIWLRRYRSIGRLLPDLNAVKIDREPQGCLAALDTLAALAPRQQLPEFDLRPTPLGAALLSALTGVLSALGVLPWLFTPLLAIAWFGSGLLLHARQPTATGELGLRRALLPASWCWGGPALAGWAVVAYLSPPPLPWAAGPTVLAWLLLLVVVATSWWISARRWRIEVDLAELSEQVEQIDRLVHRVARADWRPSARRALFADGLGQAVLGLTAIQAALAARTEDLFTPLPGKEIAPATDGEPEPPPDRDVYEEVREVVLTDLVDLTLAALRPCWAGIEAGRPVDPAEYTRSCDRLLASYHEHVRRHGLLPAPPFAFNGDRAHRDTLATKLWAASRVTEALSRTAGDEMTQLCHHRHLGVVSALAAGAELVRFASTAVRELTRESGGPGREVAWTGDSELAGSMRFVPLRQGVFE
ncbi:MULTISPECIES: hypothetical protein [unclassified Crossiella]|uniref:hypothetical protein n=1 Tax=unclassified Crossiella TaxID=2620835 RepID=UPI001FFFECFC|nr:MULTISPECIES: hypothetical protein [unclassified Crossiella]MCK2243615.1 hypothetical protein [Crossiella sp. S99.2]MCK2257473.1 hypothetical protein [Crossiella sp. S99.1]